MENKINKNQSTATIYNRTYCCLPLGNYNNILVVVCSCNDCQNKETFLL